MPRFVLATLNLAPSERSARASARAHFPRHVKHAGRIVTCFLYYAGAAQSDPATGAAHPGVKAHVRAQAYLQAH